MKPLTPAVAYYRMSSDTQEGGVSFRAKRSVYKNSQPPSRKETSEGGWQRLVCGFEFRFGHLLKAK